MIDSIPAPAKISHGEIPVSMLGLGVCGTCIVGSRASSEERSGSYLQQVGGQHVAAVAVVEGERGGEGRHGHAQQSGLSHHLPQRHLVRANALAEVRRQQKVRQLRVLRERVLINQNECTVSVIERREFSRNGYRLVRKLLSPFGYLTIV